MKYSGDSSYKVVEADFMTRVGQYVRRPVIDVTIGSNDLQKCFEVDFWCSDKQDDYGKSDDWENADKKVVVGLLGETAFGLFINRIPHLAYIEGGDEQDFIYRGKTIDVKNAMKKRSGPSITKSRYGKIQSVKDVYIVGYTRNLDKLADIHVIMVGMFLRVDLENAKETKSIYKNTMNYDLLYSDSREIVKL